MRLLRFAITIGVLVGLLMVLWAHRFVPADGASAARLDALVLLGDAPRGFTRTGDSMRIDAAAPAAGVSFAIPGAEGARHVLLRFQSSAHGLTPGDERWEDGRLFIEWIHQSGRILSVDRVHSARNDSVSDLTVLVFTAPKPGATPVLRFQNQGIAGSYAVDFIEITPVRERALWSFGKWLLIAGFLGAIAAFHAGTQRPARWRCWAAAGIWVAVAMGYAFPGPWEAAIPYGIPFAIADVDVMVPGEVEIDTQTLPPRHPTDANVAPPPPPNDLGLRLKIWLPWLRPLLHIALMGVPVFAMAWLVGPRTSMWLGFLLSISVEASQVLFGFGFGWDDVGDLIVNTFAIFSALWLFRRSAPRIHKLIPLPTPVPMLENPGRKEG